MCRICVDFQLGRLSPKEALKNASEMLPHASGDERDHLVRVMDEAADREVQQNHDRAVDQWWSDGGSSNA